MMRYGKDMILYSDALDMKDVWENFKKKENFNVLKSYLDNSYFLNLRKVHNENKKKEKVEIPENTNQKDKAENNEHVD